MQCQTTMPRRQRVYTTVDRLSLRYRMLDVLVRRLFPDYDVDTMQGLQALAADKGIEVPQDENDISPLLPTRDSEAQPDTRGALPTEAGSRDQLPPQEQANDVNRGGDMTVPDGIPEGWLLPAPNGGYHYVGTASLVYFAHTARRLVSKSNLATTPTYDEAGLRTFLRTAEFTTYKVSHAIEDGKHGNPLALTPEDSTESQDIAPAYLDTRRRSSHTGALPGSTYDGPVGGLPDRATSDLLVQAFFDHAHLNFPVFHRGAFQVKYEATWSPHSERQLFTQDPGWLASLLMVLVIGAQKLEADLGGQPQALHHRCLTILFRDGLERIVLSSTLSNVQALLLLSMYQHNMGERNSAWLLAGQAARSAVALGMHRDGGDDGNFDPFERNTRRLVWSTVYTFEQTISLALGRPSFTETVNVTASLPDTTFTNSIGLPQDLLGSSLKLAGLHTQVRRFISTASPNYASPSKLVLSCSTANSLLGELLTWRSNLPDHLSPRHPSLRPAQRRAVLLMHVWSYYLESIITRPFILCRVDHDIPTSARSPPPLPKEIAELASRCVQAADSSVELLLELEASGLLEGCVHLDFYAIYHATMIIGVHFLTRPPETDSDANDEGIRADISALLARSKGVSVAPTYRILMNIAMPLAYISGIAPEADNAPEISPAPDTSTSFTSMSTTFNDMTAASHNGLSANMGGAVQHQTTLEQLFGPMPQFQQDDLSLDVFADLYAVGIDPNDVNLQAFAM